jgi:DNA repair photolyase
MEPRTSQPGRRLQAIEKLSKAGIPVGVNVAPIIPGLTDHECANILKAAKDAGATRAGYTLVRLPFGVKELFKDWLEQHFPDRKDKVLNKIRDIRGGKLNDSTYGQRFKGNGNYAQQIADLFDIYTNRLGLNKERTLLSTAAFRPARGYQMDLF